MSGWSIIIQMTIIVIIIIKKYLLYIFYLLFLFFFFFLRIERQTKSIFFHSHQHTVDLTCTEPRRFLKTKPFFLGLTGTQSKRLFCQVIYWCRYFVRTQKTYSLLIPSRCLWMYEWNKACGKHNLMILWRFVLYHELLTLTPQTVLS